VGQQRLEWRAAKHRGKRVGGYHIAFSLFSGSLEMAGASIKSASAAVMKSS
jgi:hypothetical protein